MVERGSVPGIARREPGEEVEVRLLGVLRRPLDRRGRRPGEGRCVELAEHRKVVVPDQADLTPLARQLDAEVGIGAVSDDVAEAPSLLDAGLVAVAENRLESGQIGVDVAEDCYEHERRRTAARRVGVGPGRVYRRCGWLGADLRALDRAPG